MYHNQQKGTIMKATKTVPVDILEEVQHIAVKTGLMEPADGIITVKIWLERVQLFEKDGTPVGAPTYIHNYTVTKKGGK